VTAVTGCPYAHGVPFDPVSAEAAADPQPWLPHMTLPRPARLQLAWDLPARARRDDNGHAALAW
jgi:hypothetical protein